MKANTLLSRVFTGLAVLAILIATAAVSTAATIQPILPSDTFDKARVKINANDSALNAEIGGTTNSLTWVSNSVVWASNMVIWASNTATWASNMVAAIGSTNFIPSQSNMYDLGSAAMPWRDLYLGSNSLYMGGTKVMSYVNGELVLSNSAGRFVFGKGVYGATDESFLIATNGYGSGSIRELDVGSLVLMDLPYNVAPYSSISAIFPAAVSNSEGLMIGAELFVSSLFFSGDGHYSGFGSGREIVLDYPEYFQVRYASGPSVIFNSNAVVSSGMNLGSAAQPWPRVYATDSYVGDLAAFRKDPKSPSLGIEVRTNMIARDIVSYPYYDTNFIQQQVSPGATTGAYVCAANDGSRIAIAPTNGQLRISTNGGTSWAAVGDTHTWSSFLLCSSNMSVILGTDLLNYYYLSTNYGATFSTTAVPVSASFGQLSPDGNTIVLMDNASAGKISYNQGGSWNNFNPSAGSVTYAAFSDSGKYMAVVGTVPNQTKVHWSSDYGTNWTTSGTAPVNTILVDGLAVSDSGELLTIFAKSSGGIYRELHYSYDGGATWPAAGFPVDYRRVTVATNGTRVAQWQSGTTGNILVSYDNGTNFVIGFTPNVNYSDMHVNYDMTRFVGISGTNVYINEISIPGYESNSITGFADIESDVMRAGTLFVGESNYTTNANTALFGHGNTNIASEYSYIFGVTNTCDDSDYSMIVGRGNRVYATGVYAYNNVFGDVNYITSGMHNVIFGYENELLTTGVYNTVFGAANRILGSNTRTFNTIFGSGIDVSNSFCFSAGLWNEVLGRGSVALGTGAKAYGQGSFAMGWNGLGASRTNLIASGEGSVVFGSSANAGASDPYTESISAVGNGAMAVGYRTSGEYIGAVGEASVAMGRNVRAYGNESVAFVRDNLATANYSFVCGYLNSATGLASHAEGQGNRAYGRWSHAEGVLNTAARDGSHVEGGSNFAEGGYDHVEGAFNYSTGQNSHAEGYSNQVYGSASHVGGSFGTVLSSNAYLWSSGYPWTNAVAGGYDIIATGGVRVLGSIVPVASNAYDLGSEAMPWRDVYVSTGSVHIGKAVLSADTNGNLIVQAGTNAPAAVESETEYVTGFTIDGSAAPVTAGSKGFFRVPKSGTISKWVIRTDNNSTTIVDIAKCSAEAYPVASSIVASAPVTLTNQKCVTNTTLTGWTKAVTAGEYLKYSFTTNSSATNVAFELTITR